MGAIFTPIYPNELKTSVPKIQALILSHRESKWTGIIRLGYSSGKYLQLLFKQGGLINNYLIESETRTSLLTDECPSWIEGAGDAYFKDTQLSSYGLFTSKLLVTSDSKKIENFSESGSLSEYLAVLGKKPECSLVHLNWDHAVGGILFPGSQNNAYSIFLSQDNVTDEVGVSTIFSQWQESSCRVTVFVPDISVDAWQEYYLRLVFVNIYGSVLERFEIMTGRALIDSLVRLVAIFVARNNLDIVVSSRKLIDREVFASPQQAVQVYSQILKEMFSHFSAVVGPRLLALTIRDVVSGFPEYEREVIRTHSIFPEGYYYE